MGRVRSEPPPHPEAENSAFRYDIVISALVREIYHFSYINSAEFLQIGATLSDMRGFRHPPDTPQSEFCRISRFAEPGSRIARSKHR